METQSEMKPNKQAFVNWHFAVGFVITLVIFSIAFFIINAIFPGSGILIIAAFVLINAFSYYALTVRYGKEKYIYLQDKIIAKGGGIFHDRQTELVIRNITHVTLVRPWLEYKFFKTGRIIVELAGSAAAEAVITSVDKPEEVYNGIIQIMQAGGFRLQKGKLVQKERPSLLGVFFETMRVFFGSLIGIFFFGLYALNIIADLLTSGVLDIWTVLLVVGLFLLWTLAHSAIRFLDLMKRIYYIYDDTIVYSEGFLTKVDSFMPIENLADSEVTQTLIDKIFGLYDVRVSCQGAAHEILFKNMVNGPAMEKNIDALINQTQTLVGRKAKEKVSAGVKSTKVVPGKTLPLTVEKSYTGNFQMEMVRSIAPIGLFVLAGLVLGILLLFIFPFFGIMVVGAAIFLPIFMIIGVAIKVVSTNYSIKGQGMMEKFNFLNMREVEFSNDKITGVVFSRNFIDEWFNTFSIKFWSIGASHDVNFSNIKEPAELRSKVLAKFGITGKEEPIYREESRFSYVEMLKANIGLFFIGILVFAALIILGLSNPLFFVLALLLAILTAATVTYKGYYYKTSKIFFYKNYVHFSVGIFFKSYYYALYDNVKDISTVRYPFSSLGSISFNVAGEALPGGQHQPHTPQRKGAAKGMLVPHHFVMTYVPKIQDKDELIDLIFYKRPSQKEVASIEANLQQYAPKDILVAKPMAANSLLIMVPIAFLVFVFVSIISLALIEVIGPIGFLVAPVLGLLVGAAIIGFTIWGIKVMSYAIQPYRVIAKSGIFYKRQTSIVFTKIDHLRTFQGITHKMFNNGMVIVHTTGSSQPEITVRDIPNFRAFYAELEKYY